MTEHWFFDSHAHYSDPRFLEDQEALLGSMAEHGIGRIMNIGCCEQSSRDSIALAERYDFIYATVGSHPDSADEVDEALLKNALVSMVMSDGAVLNDFVDLTKKEQFVTTKDCAGDKRHYKIITEITE